MDSAAQGAHLYRLFWRWHFFAAALVIPFVLWQSVTGTLYLWSEWWMDVRHPDLRFVQAATAKPYAVQIASALATSPGGSVQNVIVPDDPGRSVTVLMTQTSVLSAPVFVDPGTAQVVGHLTAAEWLPSLSRGLHAGWPLGRLGNGLLELGDCWAIVMLTTGLCLWWTRSHRSWRALWPRFNAGPRVLIRDLHSCVAVWFSAVFLFFLVSALPWTSFWGGQILPPIQKILGQESPAGFSPGGAATAAFEKSLPSLDAVIAHARATNIRGDLEIRLAPWPRAPWWVRNQNNPGLDRYLIADTENAEPLAELGGGDLPLIPRMVALGVHVHQGDYGPVNRWLNTAFAASLIWLSITGLLSWWHRRPSGQLGVPPASTFKWPRGLIFAVVILCAILPLFGASLIVLVALTKAVGIGRSLRRHLTR